MKMATTSKIKWVTGAVLSGSRFDTCSAREKGLFLSRNTINLYSEIEQQSDYLLLGNLLVQQVSQTAFT
jgi:hypothetical protein